MYVLHSDLIAIKTSTRIHTRSNLHLYCTEMEKRPLTMTACMGGIAIAIILSESESGRQEANKLVVSKAYIEP